MNEVIDKFITQELKSRLLIMLIIVASFNTTFYTSILLVFPNLFSDYFSGFSSQATGVADVNEVIEKLITQEATHKLIGRSLNAYYRLLVFYLLFTGDGRCRRERSYREVHHLRCDPQAEKEITYCLFPWG